MIMSIFVRRLLLAESFASKITRLRPTGSQNRNIMIYDRKLTAVAGKLQKMNGVNVIQKWFTTGQGEKEIASPSSKRRGIVSLKEPINITDKGREFFLTALESISRSDVVGIILRYQQHSSGDPRMVFSFDFVTDMELHKLDEPCRLSDKFNLYVHHNAFMKVLGGTVDFSNKVGLPVVLDREGNDLDPNF